MRNPIQPQSKCTPEHDLPRQSSSKSPSALAGSLLLTLASAAVLFACQLLFAAQPPPQQASATQHAVTGSAHKPVHRRARSSAAHSNAQPAAAAPVPEAPKPPEAPVWPANGHPVPASVLWDSHGLRIEATNSSLEQILKDVETATGAEVEGVVNDERVFGAYGPGSARDVLSQLLQGTGYNVIMIGDLGQGTPRQILLSSRTSGDAQAANKNASNDGEEDPTENDTEEQPVAPPMRSGFVPGGPPRTPQQIMQEMQQRQQGAPQRPTPP
jgi:hypothetical protein